MSNNVCRNYDIDKEANSILGSIRLHCGQCEHSGNCVIETAYPKAKDYAASMEFVVDSKESEVEDACRDRSL